MSTLKPNIELLTIFFKKGQHKQLLTVVYRPPGNSNFDEFIITMTSLMNYKRENYKHTPIDILGDFNCNIANRQNNCTKKFLELSEKHDLKILINIPTRITSTTLTTIDNIMTSDLRPSIQYVIPAPISDHCMILKTIDLNSNERHHKSSYRSYRPEKIEAFKSKLKETNWDNVLKENNPSEAFENYFKKIEDIFNTSFPLKTSNKAKKYKEPPWLTQQSKLAYRAEKKAFLKFIKNRNDESKKEHMLKKKEAQKTIRDDKIQYYKDFFRNHNADAKSIWLKINSIINKHKSKKEEIPCITINETSQVKDSDIANTFNNFFSSVGMSLATKFQNSHQETKEYLDTIPTVTNKLKFHQISEIELNNIIKKMKPKLSCGPDNIPTKIMINIARAIPKVIIKLINISLNTGFIPDILKQSNIIPIHKKGIKTDPNNYRPISLLCSLSKILEKAVAIQLNDHLERNNIISNSQFGFRKGTGTSHALLFNLNKQEKYKNKNHKYCSVYIDLKKAFDTVDTSILLSKLEKYGTTATELKWFKSYLTGRKQQVRIKNSYSELKNIDIGVPQGSVLGPILFIIYINDITALGEEKFCLFADDTSLNMGNSNLTQLQNDVNQTLKDTQRWIKINKLTLNADKTRVIKYNLKKNDRINIFIDDKLVTEIKDNTNESSFKFLGLNINEKSDLKHHFISLLSKLRSATFTLGNVKNILPTKQKMLIYNALFKSHVEYGITCWPVKNNYLSQIFQLQKKAIRYIDGGSAKKHTEPLFRKHKLLKIHDIVEYHRLLLAHSIKFGYAPKQMYSILQNINEHDRLRRNLNNIISQDQTNCTKTIMNTWNNLPESLKQVEKRNTFTRKIKQLLIEKYSMNRCNNRNCFICI